MAENQNVVKIVGIRVSPNKNNPGMFYYNYFYVGRFSDYDLKHSHVQGSPCGEEFSTVDIGCKVGDEVELKYAKGFQDKATLIGCTVIKAAAASTK